MDQSTSYLLTLSTTLLWDVPSEWQGVCNWHIPPSCWNYTRHLASREVISLVAKQANLRRPRAARGGTELSLFTVRSILARPKRSWAKLGVDPNGELVMWNNKASIPNMVIICNNRFSPIPQCDEQHSDPSHFSGKRMEPSPCKWVSCYDFPRWLGELTASDLRPISINRNTVAGSPQWV